MGAGPLTRVWEGVDCAESGTESEKCVSSTLSCVCACVFMCVHTLHCDGCQSHPVAPLQLQPSLGPSGAALRHLLPCLVPGGCSLLGQGDEGRVEGGDDHLRLDLLESITEVYGICGSEGEDTEALHARTILHEVEAGTGEVVRAYGHLYGSLLTDADL